MCDCVLATVRTKRSRKFKHGEMKLRHLPFPLSLFPRCSPNYPKQYNSTTKMINCHCIFQERKRVQCEIGNSSLEQVPVKPHPSHITKNTYKHSYPNMRPFIKHRRTHPRLPTIQNIPARGRRWIDPPCL